MSEERYQWERIVSVADVMKPAVENFKKMEDEAAAFGKKLDKFLVGKSRKCPFHEVPLPIDRPKSFSESWFNRKDGGMKVFFGNCKECEKEENSVIVNELWLKRGIPENLLSATFENYSTDSEGKQKALDDVRQQMGRKGFLILRGTWGTGKTHLAVAALKTVGGEMITQADLVGLLRQTYADNAGPEDLVKKYRECECLVLDELDSQVKGVDIPQLLYRILAHRYDDGKFTIITSNEKLDVILDILGPKLTDRIKDNYLVVPFDWKSYRGT